MLEGFREHIIRTSGELVYDRMLNSLGDHGGTTCIGLAMKCFGFDFFLSEFGIANFNQIGYLFRREMVAENVDGRLNGDPNLANFVEYDTSDCRFAHCGIYLHSEAPKVFHKFVDEPTSITNPRISLVPVSYRYQSLDDNPWEEQVPARYYAFQTEKIKFP